MKKLIALLLSIAMLASLAGCAGTTVVVGNCTCPPEANAPVETPTEAPAVEATESTDGSLLKTGLAILPNVSGSTSATAEENGKADYDVTVAAVTVDENGVIRSCVIDSVGTSIAFGADGVITSDLNAAVLTKNELGEGYGMKAYGGATYEWYEQAAALAEFAVGKTIEEFKGGYAGDVDLAATATIYLGGYVAAVEKAVANAQDLGAKAGDVLKLAVTSSLSDSTNADAENAGNAQLYLNAAAVTFNGDVITSCAIDSVQAKVAFDTTGTITSDVSVAPQTKNELGEAYGMKAWGGATFEWNEQAANFAAYITGKTTADVAGIAVTETTKPAEGTDLAASVTISIGDFQTLIEKTAPVSDEAATLKTGLAVIANISGSAATTAEANGKADYDITVAAVTVDENGIIRDCIIDSIGTSVAFDAAGLPVDFDASKAILTKNELGDNYGMKAYGGATYEWYEQAAALANFAVGKTVEEFVGGYAGDVDLATTATIYLGGYVAAVEKAVANAQNLGAKEGDELKLAVINTMEAAAAEEAGGSAQLTVDVAAVTMAGDVITSAYIDALQAKVEFDGTGALITDVAVAPQTKNELGEAYGMKAWAGAKFEWNEQAANFAAYITGKTPAEVAGIAIAETTKPAEGTDLAASVTISIGGFLALIAKIAG